MTQQPSSRRLTIQLLFAAAFVLAVGLPIRIYQQLYLIEPTGFWARFEPTQVVLYLLLGLLALAPGGMAWFAQPRAALDLGRRRRAAEGVAAFAAAASLMVDAVFAGLYALELLNKAPFSATAALGAQIVMRSGGLGAMGEALFALCGAAFFINLALIDLLPNKKIYLNRLLALAPLFWCVCRILRRFARTISYLRVSDLFLNLCMLVALMLFFLPFAQILSGVNGERRAARLGAAGAAAAALQLLCFLPRAVAWAANIPLSQDALVEACDPVVAAFILIFLAGRLLVSDSSVASIAAPAQESAPEAEG
ncbi:MAG: hypothetical protein LBG83_02950 [Oscillospiraceae bacterium]|jgi:hypothetical protein|nr:hypothetical protein [Oscillospiraceae bacterium]